MFRKSAYEKAGGADEGLRLCGDWKIWAMMASTGRIAYTAEPLNYFRSHNTSVRSQAEPTQALVSEGLGVIHWILDHVPLSESALEVMRERHAGNWAPALMSLHVPLTQKRAILREVRSIDPHPFRRVLRPVLGVVRRKIARHWRSLGPTNSRAAH